MTLLPDLTQRQRQPEIMDRPDLPRPEHFHALKGLQRINGWSGSAHILWPAIRDLAHELAPRPVRVLDLATGAGDVPIRVWFKARRAGLAVELAGCDRSLDAVEFAAERAQDRGAAIRFFQLDAMTDDLSADYDVLTASLFLHHLDTEQAVALLRSMARAARRLVLINDLIRSSVGLALAHVACRVLTRSPVVHSDGPRSVEGAFTMAEARELARRAGLEGATVTWRWPFRYLLSWSKR